MKQNDLVKIEEPNYYQNFKCSPDRCKETCCSHWRILVDEITYHCYMDSSNPAIKRIAMESLKQNTNRTGFEDYGILELTQQLNCPFLEETGLCKVITLIGETKLSKTCKHYPRVMSQVGERLQLSLETSCSVAAEVVLFSEDGLTFLDQSRQLSLSEVLLTDLALTDSEVLDFNKLIRDTVIELLQIRTYGLTQRIVLIGLFLEAVNDDSDIHFARVNKDLESSVKRIKSAVISQMNSKGLLGTAHNSLKPFEHFNTLLAMRFSKQDGSSLLSKVYMGCLSEVLSAFGRSKRTNLEEVYREGYVRYLHPYLRNREILIENFLVNTVYIYGLKYFQRNSMQSGFLKLFSLYGLVQFNLIGMAIYQKGMNDSEVLRLVHSFSKMMLSDPRDLERVCTHYEMRGLKSIEDLVGLLL